VTTAQKGDAVFRRILVGFDGSHCAREALRCAAGLASSGGGEATALIVIPSSHGETDDDRRRAFETEADALREMAEQDFRRLALADNVELTVEAVSGERPGETLARHMREHGYDVLVLGRHGRERLSHPGLGHVAHELAGKAAFPLLLVGDGVPGGR
jgi:nucleotide-binding universal stress UspA family protein